MDQEEYTSDEGNYSSLSSASGFFTLEALEDETDFRANQIGSTDTEKHLLLQIDKCKQSIWRKQHSKTSSPSKIAESLLKEINHELGVQNVSLETENKELKLKFNTLQKEINKLSSEKDCRESCIQQLKNKIAEQQENIHDLTQQNFKININLSTLNNDLTTTKGTVDWYKNEWTNASNERNVLQKELFLLRNNLRNKKLAITRLEALLTDLKLQSLQDAKNLELANKSLNTNKNQSVSDVKTNEGQEKQNDNPNTKETEIITKYYLTEIEDLNKQILSVKTSLTQQTEVLSQLLQDKTELSQKNAVLQKEFEDEKVFRASCEEKLQKLKETNDYHLDTIKRKDQDVLELKTNTNKLKTELESLAKEKSTVQETINATRNSFHKMVALQDELKENIKLKDKMVLTLEKKIQDSFMFENWNKCAIEEFAIKEENYNKRVKDLLAAVDQLKQEIDAKISDSSKLRLEVDEVKKYCKSVMAANDELKDKVERTNMEKEMVENEKRKVEEIVNNLKHKLAQTTIAAVHVSSVGSDSNSNPNLKEQLELRCVHMAKKNSNANQIISKLEDEIHKSHDAVYIKQVELSDMQKRYELYYRAMLNTVKEYKKEMNATRLDNKQLRIQQQDMMEELNTRKLQLFQYQLDKDSDTNFITKKTALVKQLQGVLKEKHVHIEELSNNFELLNSNYERLVSTHSKCLSTIETTTKGEQDKLDNDKIANCTIVNTQHALIEKLQAEKGNALKLIKTLEMLNKDDKLQMQSLLREKSFLQRLVIDMKAALNASAAKQKFNMTKPLVVPLDLKQFSCLMLPDESEILNLCMKQEKSEKPSGNLQERLIALKEEMSNVKILLSDIKFI